MNKQVLLVDDSADIHPLVKALLGEEPVDVHSATDPTFGLTLAASLKPDLILLDVDMPVMDGYEFCRRLKADGALGSVPVVFLTARGDSEQKVRGLHLGAVDYVTKPFSPGELLARVCSALRTQSVITELEDRSLTDALTGLGNRRMFASRMRAEASGRARSPKPLACAYVDVDGIHTINQLYGDTFGDQVLKKVADVMRTAYRPEDVACRMRDDDFAILMPDTGVDDAVALAREFKAKLARAALTHRQARVPVTCGVGVAGALDAYDQSVFERAVNALERPLVAKSDDLQIWDASCPAITARAA